MIILLIALRFSVSVYMFATNKKILNIVYENQSNYIIIAILRSVLLPKVGFFKYFLFLK